MKKMNVPRPLATALLASFLAFGFTNADDDDSRPLADEATAKVVEDRSTKILSYLTGESDVLPEELIATADDIPEIENRDLIIQNLRDEIASLRDSLSSEGSSFEKIEVYEPHTTRGLTIATATVWGRESQDGELESRDLEWVKTSTGEWKLILP